MTTVAAAADPIRPDYLMQAYVRHATLAGPRPPEADQWPEPLPRTTQELVTAQNIEAFVAYLSRPQPPAEATLFATEVEAAEGSRRFVERVRTTLQSLQGLREALGPRAERLPDDPGTRQAQRLLAREDAILGGLTSAAKARFELSGALVERRPDGIGLGAFALTFRGEGFTVRVGSGAVAFVASEGQSFRPYQAAALNPPRPAAAASAPPPVRP